MKDFTRLFGFSAIFLLVLMIKPVSSQTNIVNENIQTWTARGSYGTYTQTITVDAGTGTVNMVQCIVQPSASASGTGSLGRVQMQGANGILELPEVPSVSNISFNIVAGGAGRTVKLQEYNGSSWVDIVTFTGIGTIGATYSHSINSASAKSLRLASPSAAIYVHDIIITDFSSANYPDWCNLQWPSSGTIVIGNEFLVYSQIYEDGVTNHAGQGAGISAWIGYNTANTNPSTWTNWVAATYHGDSGNNDEYRADIGSVIPATGTYYYASRFTVDGTNYSYGGFNGGFWDGTTNVSGVLTVNANYPDFCNLQWPPSGTITTGGEFLVYAKVYEEGVTNGEGQGPGISAWIGYSTDNTNPETWTNWVAADYNLSILNDDEYMADIGSIISSAGTYYYASRFTVDGSNYSYGGYNGGFWNGTTNVSGVLTVNANLPDWCNLQWPENGDISEGGEFLVYAQVYKAGVTEAAGQGDNVSGWIGYSTENTNPNTWTNWIPASFHSQQGGNDEFIADIGSGLSSGTYYYASRFKVNPNADEFSYGGFNSGGGGFWDGSTNVSGVLNITKPMITTSESELSGFTYMEGEGPSAEQNFTVSGSNLIADITLTPPTNYEISTGTGVLFSPENPLILTQTGGTVNPITVYVRLKSGLLEAEYNNEFITLSSSNAVNKTVILNGEVTEYDNSCGTETFDNFTATGSPYTSGTFLGQDGSTWTYTEARGDYEITGKALMIGKDRTPQSNLVSGTIIGGVGTISFDYMQAFSANVNLNIMINDVVVGNVKSSSEQSIIKNSGEIIVNQTGNFVIKFINVNNSDGQVVIDNITWTCFEAACFTPENHASAISVSSINDNSANISWTNGDGTNRIILMKEGSDVDEIPADNTSYTADNTFGNGSEIGTGNFVIFNGTESNFSVNGLIPGKTYFFKIYEYACAEGAEQYYTGGTPANGTFYTRPATPTGFTAGCITNTEINLSWSAPTGDFDGYLLIARENTSEHSVNSLDPSSQTHNTNYSIAPSYGSTSPESRVLYLGTNTFANISGLSTGTSYTFRVYAYKIGIGDYKYSTSTSTTREISLNNVTGATALALNGSAMVSWSNPPSACFDEILVVANETAGFDFTPTGDGSLYIADNHYSVPNQIVHKGNSDFNSIDVSGLVNGNSYYFEIFVRKGTEWSSGVEVSVIPADVTILESGDIAIIAVNTQYLESGGDDEFCFIAFKDIKEGTSIEFTDNGYERISEGLWGDTEGTIRFTRNSGGDIPAGTPICIRGAGYQPTAFSIQVCGVSDDANWSFMSLNGSTDFNLNSDDQIWIFQNGTWINPAGSHNAVYSGNIVWGWTGIGWEENPGYSSTSGSTLVPGADCFNCNLEGLATAGKVKYTGDISPATQIDWILRINDKNNWTNYANNTAYNSEVGRDYSGTCISFVINEGGFTSGKWTGLADNDWFYCANWENLKIPNKTIDVDIPTVANTPILLSGNAECKNLTITGSITLNHNDANLNVYGNFENNGNLTANAGKVIMKGNNSVISGSSDIAFHNIDINKYDASNTLTLLKDISINNVLNLQTGVVITNEYRIISRYVNEAAITGYGLNSYISGKLRRYLSTAAEYSFPVGSPSILQLLTLEINTASNLDYIDVEFKTDGLGSTDIASLGLEVIGTPLQTILDGGYWTVSPNIELTDIDYDITLNLRASSNAGLEAGQHTVIKRSNSSENWELQGNHNNATQQIAGGVVIAKRTALTEFSEFAIAKHNNNILPVEFLSFTAECQNNKTLLKWVTASETNSDYFEIQYSVDARNWKKIDIVAAAGYSNSLIYYSFLTNYDKQLYFRLKQFDYDGSYDYSPIVQNKCVQEFFPEVSIYPNPAYDKFFLNISNWDAQEFKIDIFNSQGQIIMSDFIYDEYNPIEINTIGLKPGLYFIRIYDKETNVTLRFEKIK